MRGLQTNQQCNDALATSLATIAEQIRAAVAEKSNVNLLSPDDLLALVADIIDSEAKRLRKRR